MEVVLKEKPQRVTIIQGFPGFGLVGSIATEFLVEHLNARYIGHIWLDSLMPTIAIHKGNRINPISIYYVEDHNIVLIHGITASKGSEWNIAKAVQQAANELAATQIICLEGIGSPSKEGMKVMFFSSDSHFSDKLKECGYEPLQEGIVLGITAGTLIRTKNVALSCIFAETHTDLPDSKGAAKLIEALDKAIGLHVDYKPLLKQAEEFESKLKNLLTQTQEVEKEQKRRQESYIG